MPNSSNPQVSQDYKLSSKAKVLPLTSILTAIIVIFLAVIFFNGTMYRFYASFLFLVYAFTQKMWISVILLGVFQTIILIPLRTFNIIRSNNIHEFQKNIKHLEGETLQRTQVKREFNIGNKYFLFYLTDFLIQLTTFLTIGRLFLTDFYNTQLSPDRLYSFVPYPDYPIQDTFFKVPYPAITETTTLGWKIQLLIWLGLILLQIVGMVIKHFINKAKKGKPIIYTQIRNKYAIGYALIFFYISWLIAHNYPTDWELGIFTGNVAIPNRTLNTITAIVTFITLLWFGTQRIIRKSKLAQEKGISQPIIDSTQKQMFKETILRASLIGLGAFYITNQIPSAFELSIFTLEIISLISPFTLDKAILKMKKKKHEVQIIKNTEKSKVEKESAQKEKTEQKSSKNSKNIQEGSETKQ